MLAPCGVCCETGHLSTPLSLREVDPDRKSDHAEERHKAEADADRRGLRSLLRGGVRIIVEPTDDPIQTERPESDRTEPCESEKRSEHQEPPLFELFELVELRELRELPPSCFRSSNRS
jgi:hypothetical protein